MFIELTTAQTTKPMKKLYNLDAIEDFEKSNDQTGTIIVFKDGDTTVRVIEEYPFIKKVIGKANLIVNTEE